MSNVSLKQLEVFVTIVECGNFTEAGHRLYLAQSTVSSHIRALEDALHVDLFHRGSKRSVALTADGKRVYEYAKDVVTKCIALESDVAGEVRRELVLGSSGVPAKNLLPRYMMQFAEKYPSCCCVVRSGNSERIQQMVATGDIQIGFVGSTDNRQALVYERIAEDHLVMITPNTPRFAKLKEQGALGWDLLQEPMIFRDEGSGTQKMIDNYLSNQNIDAKKMQVRYYTAHPEMLQELVALGAGISILSALSVEDQIRAGKLIAFDLAEHPVSRNIYMVFRKKGALGELASNFVEIVRKAAQ